MKIFPPAGRLLLHSGVIFGMVLLGGTLMIKMPSKSYRDPLPAPTVEEQLLSERLKGHVAMLAETIGERNILRYRSLQQSADYINSRLRGMGYLVRAVPYHAHNREVMNLEAETKGSRQPDEIVVVGAHYDTVPGSPGANDNASGVAALLELAQLFRDVKPHRTIRFVAFVNEEPPFFQTGLMGSRVYAAAARHRGENIVAMLSLETIGYYLDEKGTQHYPPPFNLFYPDTGNFIGFVSNLDSRSLLHHCIRIFRDTTSFPSSARTLESGVELVPDLTIFFDLSPDFAIKYIGDSLYGYLKRSDLSLQQKYFHEELVKLPVEKVKIIDAGIGEDAIFTETLAAVRSIFQKEKVTQKIA